MLSDDDFFFYGNGRAGENPQDFIKKFENKDLKDTMTEGRKTAAFENRLKSGNTAEEWFEALPDKDKSTWADIKRVFLICWPKKNGLFEVRARQEQLSQGARFEGRRTRNMAGGGWARRTLPRSLGRQDPNPR